MFSIADGFDGAWIMIRGVDGERHYVDERAHEDPAIARDLIKRMRRELEEWGADVWCRHYSVRRSVLPEDLGCV